MMEALSRYILSVVTAAFILGILSSIVDRKGSAGALLRLIGGLFLTFTLVSPIAGLDFSGISDYLEEFAVSGELAAADGEAMAQAEYRTIIKDKLEAYILDKAKELGLSVTAEAATDGEGVPTEVVISGAASPYAKAQLQEMIAQDLGIPKENQLWTGPH